MNWNDVLTIAVAVAVAGLLLLVGILGLRALRQAEKDAKSPGIAALLKALEAWAIKAIYAGETIALGELATADQALTGADKKAIADKLYALLPDVIDVGGKPIPIGYVKAFVTLEVWEAFVQREFDALDALVRSNEDWLKKQVVSATSGTGSTNTASGGATIVVPPGTHDAIVAPVPPRTADQGVG